MPDLITTRQAAALYGCHVTNLTKMARRYKVACRAIVDVPYPNGTGYSRQMRWHPADILALRAAVRKAVTARRAKHRFVSRRPDVKLRAKLRQDAQLRAYWQLDRATRKRTRWQSLTITGTPNAR